MNEALYALLGAVFGGVGLKVIDIWFIPKASAVDIQAQLRDELREDMVGYRDEVAGLRDEVDYWRRVYFVLIELLLKNQVEIPEVLLNPQPPERPRPYRSNFEKDDDKEKGVKNG